MGPPINLYIKIMEKGMKLKVNKTKTMFIGRKQEYHQIYPNEIKFEQIEKQKFGISTKQN